ncbi:2-oxoacid:acceptor oxidoreductase family protein [Neomoorella thermoacetica]|uniref:2-oxoacid:acceptor oxidoreductase family protein n=1 Tax=Neomoorella thermoacetica TaxID=1525 RepID=UPI0008FB37DA|nr:2-oxoacid:acceptor oxidoreductase family protein [Moorella thermoacetica]APC09232.1 2-oxoglutarate ferredoxin oxidoreductase subunit gamma [Moorella thermoacetica]OIQ54701.1 2-oxoglutarate ferredoxin oxidoreductase subunit gamma [Moorella thermoacetica]
MAGRIEVLISGFGGQGVVRIGQTLSLAAVYQGLHTTMLISHGTETRGGYVRSQVVIAGEPVDSPVVERPDYFCALSSAAYNRFKHLVRDGLILYDPGYLEPDLSLPVRHIALPARDLAVKNLGREIFANAIFLGALTRLMAGVLEPEAVRKAMLERIRVFGEENVKALNLGYSLL